MSKGKNTQSKNSNKDIFFTPVSAGNVDNSVVAHLSWRATQLDTTTRNVLKMLLQRHKPTRLKLWQLVELAQPTVYHNNVLVQLSHSMRYDSVKSLLLGYFLLTPDQVTKREKVVLSDILSWLQEEHSQVTLIEAVEATYRGTANKVQLSLVEGFKTHKKQHRVQ